MDEPAEAKSALKGCCLMKNWISWRRKKWWAVSALTLHYYPVCRRNNKAIQTRLLMDCCLSVPPWWAASRAWRTETGIGRTHVGGGGVKLGVCGQLPAQLKFEMDQLVVPGVVAPHSCEYLADGTKVLFHGPLLDGNPAGYHKAGVHALGEDMEERDRAPNDLDVG